MDKLLTGSKGEDIACKFLEKHGYKILERNFRIRGGEIDIVARDGEYLVFVEVKSRWSDEYGPPAESMTPWKIKSLLRTAQFYLLKIKWGDGPYRLDFVSVDFADPDSIGPDLVGIGAPNPQNPKIELIKNITL